MPLDRATAVAISATMASLIAVPSSWDVPPSS
jgi:hypothetical protein